MLKLSAAYKPLAALAALVLVFSCMRSSKVVELTVLPLAVNYEVGGGDKSVAISCNDKWTVAKDADWITLSAEAGEGNSVLKVTASANPSIHNRESILTIFAGDLMRQVKVGQLGLEPELRVFPLALTAGDLGKVFDLAITSNVPWTLSVPEEAAAWVSAEPLSGEGSATVKVTVAANENVEARSAELTVTSPEGGRYTTTVSVNQTGQDPSLLIDREKIDALYEGGAFAVAITTNMDWTVTIPEEATWISADKTAGSRNDSFTLTLEKNIYRKGRSASVVVAAGDLSVTLPITQELAPLSRQTDSLALVAIYNAIDAAGWVESKKWDLTKPVDQWATGIKLTNDRVTQFSFTAALANSKWELPAEIVDLTELVTLKINKNLKGTIPAEVYTLTKLTTFNFMNNELTGSLPKEVANLKALTELNVSQNANFAGTIPAEVGELTALQTLNVATSKVAGSIPSALANCTALKSFIGNASGLTGQLPDFWASFPNLATLMLYDNDGLSGPLPASIGSLTKVTGIQLQNCNFTGNIPEEWGNINSKCGTLKLNGNKLKGVVPDAVQAHEKWNTWKPNVLTQQEGYGLTTE